jgi:hypothetical protein
MVTIYDMVTGELVAADSRRDCPAPPAEAEAQAWLAPRLEPVGADCSTSAHRALPPDLAAADLAAFLARQ